MNGTRNSAEVLPPSSPVSPSPSSSDLSSRSSKANDRFVSLVDSLGVCGILSETNFVQPLFFPLVWVPTAAQSLLTSEFPKIFRFSSNFFSFFGRIFRDFASLSECFFPNPPTLPTLCSFEIFGLSSNFLNVFFRFFSLSSVVLSETSEASFAHCSVELFFRFPRTLR
eukprot:TRINITY_DN9458_c0_g2_i9.p1 TRINITY_DN9458_c0_g2~~TRINITY_DN9458_c0_g2_i9.p1  ORF type:complete len:168 (-),score=21.95 TRINITY_DN9458_c0_g2_i9:98-601(-)